ncbi:DUF5787 family protein [Halobacteria archaeon AArc-m2/3/4]|uniref:DUF5787 family protein n=1 Tax=Natronoglomus mannanivorans TaxID=2979990 RepID=A0ABT2QHC5_9EURY|nr:DUF5787 family protein [Halobacteria archaeon AArc-m2/3/4]
MSEFAFELELCAALEDGEYGDSVVARQLGGSVADPGGRILDIVCVESGPEFADRVAITGETIPGAAIESAIGTGRARFWKDAFDCHTERARRIVERACEIGFFARERRGGRDYVRQVARYPDWYGRIVGIENKPDLGTPGDLEAQLRTDASLGLVDEAILATESYVTRAHLNRIPEVIGVWRFFPESGDLEVIREPTPLPVSEPGIELLAEHPGRTEIAVVSAAEKARARRRLAERAYGKGWRTYAFPDCGACEPTTDRDETLPYCTWKECVVDPASECGAACGGFEAVETPDIDLEAERERRTSWVADPGGARRQSGLDRFL